MREILSRPLSRLNRSVSLKTRLLSGFLALLLLSVLTIASFLQLFNQVNAADIGSHLLSREIAFIQSLDKAVKMTALGIPDYSRPASPSDLKRWAHGMEQLDKLSAAGRKKLEDGLVGQGLGPVLRDIDELRRLEGELLVEKEAAEKTRLLSGTNLLKQRIFARTARLIDADRRHVDNLVAGLVRDNKSVIYKSMAVFGLIGLLVTILAFLAYTSIIKPIGWLQAGVKKIAAGHLAYRVEVVGKDEISALARDFNKMAQSLQESYSDMRRRYSQLTNLYEISKAVSFSHDLDELLQSVLGKSLELMGAQAGSIMLLTPKGDELTIRAAKGLDEWTIENTRVKLGEGISGSVALEGKPLMIQEEVRKARSRGAADVHDALCVPLIANDKTIGVINANNKRGNKFDRHDLRFFTTLAGQIAAAIANASLVDTIREAYFNTIKVLAASIDAKDKYTHGHSERVAKYAVTIAKHMDLSEADLTRIEAAAYLHDIGKIGVPDHILNKDGALTQEEMGLIKNHPVKAAEILAHINFPWGDVIPGVRGHHERFDGGGYPDGLARLKIPLDARIIAVADSFDAMTSDRPYRKALDRTKAITELVNGRGKQFDGEAVDAFIPALLTEWMSSLPGGLAEHLEFLKL